MTEAAKTLNELQPQQRADLRIAFYTQNLHFCEGNATAEDDAKANVQFALWLHKNKLPIFSL